MRFAATTIALLLAVASATPVPNLNEANIVKDAESELSPARINDRDLMNDVGKPVVDLGFLQAHETRDVNLADVVVARASDEVENSSERRAMAPANHQSGLFKAGNGWAKRVLTTIIINGVNVAVTAWFNDIHTLIVQFNAAFPNAPNFVTAGIEDMSTGMERSPWKIFWDEAYTLTIKPGERFQFDNQFVMWWK
ncbi:uncharacterized protein N0V96_011451 [Colletotrichum fioriniae]|uniref:uncharacterized protein n=1 Tax=Colletotrichum fioriniae TaxID=710243 RepID=UPI002300EFD2|nr:uncharacterized protein COL516b_005173 [Colletotrichum fioriniae]KAJ0305479.1 hypothetical protein COL516b_005173 [Colletotrichum fioriniae]KAJ3938719.1 hypothetical protein N0V96_011451 [Colletotrichum fioriniae]